MRELLAPGPILPTRMLRRSPLIDVWSGVTRATESEGRVVVTWEPGFRAVGTGRTGAARVSLKATTREGKVLFEGMLAPMRVGGVADAMSTDRAEFDAPAGRVQIDMTILGMAGEKLDVDARDLDVPVLAMSQLSRAVEQRHDKRPILSDLRESGAIEQDADLVFFIYRDEYYNEESEQQGLAEVICAKHRNGPTGAEKLSFMKRYAKFADLAA